MTKLNSVYSSVDYVTFPVTASYYSHHSWLIAAYSNFKTYGITPKEAAEINLVWDTYYEHLNRIDTLTSNANVSVLVIPIINTAPPALDYIEADIAHFKKIYNDTEDYILDNCSNFAKDWESLADKNIAEWNEIFDEFYSISWEYSVHFKQAVKYFCLGMYSHSSVHLWASIAPTKLTLVYNISDFTDEYYHNHEHHWLAYDGANSYVCTSCGEKKEAIKTY